MTERINWPRANNTWSTRQQGIRCSAPGCGKKAHGAVTLVKPGQNIDDPDVVRKPVCKSHIPSQVVTATQSNTEDDDPYDLEGAGLSTKQGSIISQSGAGIASKVSKGLRNASGSSFTILEPRYSGPRGAALAKAEDLPYGQVTTELGSLSPEDPSSHISALNAHQKLLNDMHNKGDVAGIKKHIAPIINKFVEGKTPWRSTSVTLDDGTKTGVQGLTHGERAIIRSVDANNNLNMKLFNHHVNRARNTLISNSVKLSPSRSGKRLAIGEAPETTEVREPTGAYANEGFLQINKETGQGGIRVPYKTLDLKSGAVTQSRPDIKDIAQSETFKQQVKSGWRRGGKTTAKIKGETTVRKRDQGPASDIIALRKATVSNEFEEPLITKKQASGHELYNRQLKKHIEATGGNESSFLAQYDPQGKKIRVRKKAAKPSNIRKEIRDGREVTVTTLPTVKPRRRRSDAGRSKAVKDTSIDW